MRKFRSTVLGAAVLALVILASACGPGEDGGERPSADGESKGNVTVGAVNFAENQIVAEMYAQVLEDAGYEVERQLTIDSREILQPALQSGEIDIAPEYLATLLLFYDPKAEPSTDPDGVARELEPHLEDEGIRLLEFSDANDTNAFVVTEETATEFDLDAVSDLEPVAGDMTLGGPPECPERPFCIPGLKDVYGIEFGDFKPLDVGGPLTVQALESGDIDVALLFSTSGVIADRGFVVLEDDKNLQAADYIAPVVNEGAYSEEIARLLDGVSARLTTENVTELNKRVEVDQEDAADVAQDFLATEGLI